MKGKFCKGGGDIIGERIVMPFLFTPLCVSFLFYHMGGRTERIRKGVEM